MVCKLTLRHVAAEATRLFTQEWLLSGMQSHMCFDIRLFGKAFIANFANVWFQV
jgi:hypothetical protein